MLKNAPQARTNKCAANSSGHRHFKKVPSNSQNSRTSFQKTHSYYGDPLLLIYIQYCKIYSVHKKLQFRKYNGRNSKIKNISHFILISQ